MLRRRLLPILFVSVALLAACSEDTPAAPAEDDELVLGQDIYARSCGSCHGAGGGGGIGPKLAGQVAEKYPDVADHRAVVVDGISGKNMPAFGGTLTDEEIDAVVRYEREVLGT